MKHLFMLELVRFISVPMFGNFRLIWKSKLCYPLLWPDGNLKISIQHILHNNTLTVLNREEKKKLTVFFKRRFRSVLPMGHLNQSSDRIFGQEGVKRRDRRKTA
jgi:hypothetical protein